MPRQIKQSLTFALLLTLVWATHASAASVSVKPSPTAKVATFGDGSKPPASVKLRVCRGGAYYDNRLVSFRVRMGRFNQTSDPQSLQMRFEVLQRLNENKRYKKLKADGLGTWFKSSDSATLYQRDLTLTNVETAATYKASVTFRWTAPDGSVSWKRKIVSTACMQKVPLPKLKLTKVIAVPIVGSTALQHTVTVVNDGRSEVVNLPVGIFVDSLSPSIAVIDSIGPNQSVDVQIEAASCQTGANAVIDPLRSIVRIPMHNRTPFPIARCS
ncbi:MAG: hypothetical protein HYX29_01625 [Solirubrobacterales bacterium]|nr:hypothetical protein [Solirubrobacterales bacterium]